MQGARERGVCTLRLLQAVVDSSAMREQRGNSVGGCVRCTGALACVRECPRCVAAVQVRSGELGAREGRCTSGAP